jgi:hypothetical protein
MSYLTAPQHEHAKKPLFFPIKAHFNELFKLDAIKIMNLLLYLNTRLL